MQDKYQGYTNFETFTVSLVLNNDQPLYNALRSIARANEPLQDRADTLRQFVEEYINVEDIDGMASTLLNHALDRVNWREVVEDSLKP